MPGTLRALYLFHTELVGQKGTKIMLEKATAPDSSLEDRQLVDLARKGDDDAFGELIRRYWTRCVDLACFYLRNRDDGEDQVQNAVLKAYQHLDQYQGEAEFSTWLARIVVNQCLMLLRAKRRTRFVCLDQGSPEPNAVPIQLAARQPSPEREFADREMSGVLRTEIRRIPPLLRNVMMLRDVEELPLAEVSEALGITASAAKSRLVRARAELRSRMVRHQASAASTAAGLSSGPRLARIA
jgi:RNA polymerase sigma-70 factor (ECF subfamily)